MIVYVGDVVLIFIFSVRTKDLRSSVFVVAWTKKSLGTIGLQVRARLTTERSKAFAASRGNSVVNHRAACGVDLTAFFFFFCPFHLNDSTNPRTRVRVDRRDDRGRGSRFRKVACRAHRTRRSVHCLRRTCEYLYGPGARAYNIHAYDVCKTTFYRFVIT